MPSPATSTSKPSARIAPPPKRRSTPRLRPPRSVAPARPPAYERCHEGVRITGDLVHVRGSTLGRPGPTRFAPSPTGSLPSAAALSAVANRRRGDWFLLRIDDTDRAREVEGAIDGSSRPRMDRCTWNDGPVRQANERSGTARPAAVVGEPDPTLHPASGARRCSDGRSPTYHLASVVDDHDFEITHVIRGADPRANTELQQQLSRALGFEPPSTCTRPCCSAPTARSSRSAPALRRSPLSRGACLRKRYAPISRSSLNRLRRPSGRVADPPPGDRRDRSLSDEACGSSRRAPQRLWRCEVRVISSKRARMAGRDPRAEAVTLPEEARPTWSGSSATGARARRQGHRARAEGVEAT